MTLDSLWPWRGAVLAFLVALAWAGLLRLLRRPDLAALGAGIGFAAGVVLTLGAIPGSPRQLPERLPMLACAGAGLAVLLALLRGGRGLPATLGAAIGVAAGAWWLAGAPMVVPDLRRGGLTLLGLLVLLAALALALRGPWQAAYGAAILCAGLALAAPLGPWLVLAAVALGAALGGAAAGPDWGPAARLPLALGLGALAAGPVIARGSALDWTVAAGPVLALWAAPAVAAQFPGRIAASAAWIVAACLALLFTWLQIRGP